MTQIHPSAVIGKDVRLGDDVVIGPNCVVDGDISIGDGCVLLANVVINGSVTIGKNNQFFPCCTIGSRPQVLRLDPKSKIGGLEIGDGNTFREQVTVHPGMHEGGSTKIGSENLIMIGVHIGHDCILEDKIVISNYTQVSGHCHIQTGAWFSGLVAMHQFVTVGRWCYAAGMTGVNHDVPPFLIVSGHYPPEVRGVNTRGLLRAGFTEQQQQAIVDAYKKLYRNGGSLLEKAKLLTSQEGIDENVRSMANAIIKSSEHRFGRYLETFRD